MGIAIRGSVVSASNTKRRKMKKIYLLGFVLVVLFTMTMSTAALETNGNPGVLASDSKSHGSTYGELSVKWWQWALGIPADENPIFDTTGENCDEGQSGSVWFLAGTSGSEVTRKCTVPAEKYIFFPIVNTVWIATDPGDTEEMGRAYNKDFIDETTLLEVKVDGVSLQKLKKNRADSPAFDVNLPENNLFGLPPGEYGPAVSDGFWVLLEPLNAGKHEIRIHGIVGDGVDKFEVKVTYHLYVEGHREN